MGLRKLKSLKHNGKRLTDILDAHQRYWASKEGGVRADLTGADLSGADLSKLDLAGAILEFPVSALFSKEKITSYLRSDLFDRISLHDEGMADPLSIIGNIAFSSSPQFANSDHRFGELYGRTGVDKVTASKPFNCTEETAAFVADLHFSQAIHDLYFFVANAVRAQISRRFHRHQTEQL
jgi:hypothetical protein